MKKGDEKVSVIAVANSRFTTEIKMNTFMERKHIPLKQLNIKNLFPMAHLLTVMMLDVQMSLRFLLIFILLQLILKDLMKIALLIYKAMYVLFRLIHLP